MKAAELPKIQAMLFAYSGKKRKLQKSLNENHFIERESGLFEAYLPLKSLVGYEDFRWDILKEIRFKIMSDEPFEMGDFRLIEFRGNPKKPTKWRGI